MNSTISIIVPIYKAEKYIDECLQSILSQSYRNIEVILVDDGSPDKSGSICDAYSKKDSRIKVIHKKNEGVSKARNDGMKIATGEWIMFVDPDDWIDENICSEFYSQVLKHRADIYICSNYVEYPNKKYENFVLDGRSRVLGNSEKYEIQLQLICKKAAKYIPKLHNMAGPWAKLYNRNFLIKNSLEFQPKLKRAQDNIFNLYAFEGASKIVYLNKCLYHYRMNSSSIWGRYSPDIINNYNNLLSETYKFISLTNKSDIFINAYYAKVATSFYSFMRLYFFNKENKKTNTEIREEMKMLLETEPYKTALLKVDFNYLTFQEQVFVYFLKIKWFMGLRILCLLRKKLKRSR